MSEPWMARTVSLIGEEGTECLAQKTVLLFGIGGVGGYAAEMLARVGIGHLILVDHDTVSDTNRNRQLIADLTTVGRKKVDVFRERIAWINPQCEVMPLCVFAAPENIPQLVEDARPDFIIDAIDCVSAKIALASYAAEHSLRLVSAMGTGNKLHPELLKIGDLSGTSVCPLARVMRTELRKRGITHLPVLYSTELPVKTGERTPASVPFVPAAGGILLASYVVNAFLAENNKKE